MDTKGIKKKSLLDIAIRLIEGGIEQIDGHSVALRHEPEISDPCDICELDYLCHMGNDFCNVCMECDFITHEDCILILMDGK